MNIFHKVALQGLKKSRTRTLVTIVGVVLSAALITGVVSFGVSLLGYMTDGAAAKYGSWHVAFSDVDAAFVSEQLQDSRVASVAAFENLGYAVLDGGQNPDKPYLFIAGFSEETYAALPVTVLVGRLPENSSELLIPAHVITNGGVPLSVGDTLTLATGSRQRQGQALSQHDPYSYEQEALYPTEEKTYTVVGICQRPYFEQVTAPGYTAITCAEPAAGRAGRFSAFVTLRHLLQLKAYTGSAGGAGYVLNDEVLRFTGLSSDRLFTSLLAAVGLVVIAIIMTGSVFLIYNSFHISLNERTRQFGILMSVGATARQLRNLVLFEGLCIGAVGIPLGILVGLGSIAAVISAVARNFGNILYADVPLTLRISPPAILASAAISLVTILISAYLPARKAAATPVMECIRQTNEVKLEARAVKTPKFAERACGLEGTLALKNFKRNKGRCRSIVLSLVLSVVLFISTNAFVVNLQQASERAVVFTTYDIGISTETMDDSQMQSLYEVLKTAPGVTQSSYQTMAAYTASVRAGDLTEAFWQGEAPLPPEEPVGLWVQIQFLDDASYQAILDSLGLPAEEYTGPDATLVACAKMEKQDNRLHEVREFDDLFTASALDFLLTSEPGAESGEAQTHPVRITFADFIMPDSLPVLVQAESYPYYFQVAAPYSLKDTLLAADTPVRSKGMTFSSGTPTQTAAEMTALLESRGILTGYTLYNISKMLDESRNMIFIANVFAYTFIVMISLIAVANVFNTISTNIKLRRRELAMLRSVGMPERAFQRMMNFECAFYGLRALAFGLPLAVLCSWLIYKGIVLGGAENITFALPWASIGISVGSVLLVIFVTMMYSVGKLKKENIIDALRDDMA